MSHARPLRSGPRALRLFQRYELTLVDPDPVPVRTPAFKGPRSPCRIGYRLRQIGNNR
jgi:hypothetical protein